MIRKRTGAQVIGDHPVLKRWTSSVPAAAADAAINVLNRSSFVVVVGALHHRRDTLKPHAGVDGGLWQLDAFIRVQLLELHEHQVPDLDEPVAVFVGRARRATWDVIAVVVKDLRAWTARPCVAHRPKVVGCGDADDLVVAQAGDLLPQAALRRPRTCERSPASGSCRQTEFLGDEVPRQLDGTLLEIVAEREVAEHLEEGVVARRVTDVFEVVMLAAGAHAFLRWSRRGHRAAVSLPVKTFLNCTMPALVNINVGSLRGTSGDDATISCPLAAK